MTQPEREIVTEAISHVSVANLRDLSVGFKENMNALYEIVFGMEDRETAFSILRSLCQHTGDVLRCVDLLLGKNKYHFHTAQKRFLVKLLESYTVKDFRANLVLSGKGAERNILLLNYLDYSEANCFFKHNLRQQCQTVNYGYIDVRNRCLIFDGAPQAWDYDWYAGVEHRRGKLSLARYLVLLLEAQGATVCSAEEDADVVLVMGKPETEKEVSIVDANFFMD